MAFLADPSFTSFNGAYRDQFLAFLFYTSWAKRAGGSETVTDSRVDVVMEEA